MSYDLRVLYSESVPSQLLPAQQVQAVLTSALRRQGVTSAIVTVNFVDDQAIHQVNREQLQHDYPTDVISFLYDSEESSDGWLLEGELIISVETALNRAAEFRWNADSELLLYVVHGLLHLCGYDDQSQDLRAEMRSEEVAILGEFDLKPHYAD